MVDRRRHLRIPAARRQPRESDTPGESVPARTTRAGRNRRARVIASEPLTIKLPHCEKGIGDVIISPASPKLIAGIECAPFAIWPDDRGYFLEVQRIGQGLAAHFPQESTQIS